jgi:hypothetical protein
VWILNDARLPLSGPPGRKDARPVDCSMSLADTLSTQKEKEPEYQIITLENI